MTADVSVSLKNQTDLGESGENHCQLSVNSQIADLFIEVNFLTLWCFCTKNLISRPATV